MVARKMVVYMLEVERRRWRAKRQRERLFELRGKSRDHFRSLKSRHAHKNLGAQTATDTEAKSENSQSPASKTDLPGTFLRVI
jgi:hypothetical protein